jgi:hypothetical protein
MDIEETSRTNPEKIFKVPVNPIDGITAEITGDLAAKAGLSGDTAAQFEAALVKLYDFFMKGDCMLAEINPIVVDKNGDIIALDGKVSVDHKVTNINDKTMWFSVGGHDGFATPEGIEEYDIILDKKETLNAYTLYGNLIGDETYPVIADTDTLALKYDYFAVDALVFKDVKSESCKLINRNTGRGIQLDFPGYPVLMVWTKPNAPYVCIEPWMGAPDHVNHNYDITKKFAIQSVEAGKTFVCSRVITAVEGK